MSVSCKVTFILCLFTLACRTHPNMDAEKFNYTSDDNFLDYEATDTSENWSSEQKNASANYYFLVAEYVAIQGDPGKSRDYYKSAFDLEPNAFLAEKYLISEINLQGHQQSQELLTLARKMTLLYPHSSNLFHILSEQYRRIGKPEKAILASKKSISLDKNFLDGYVQLISLQQKSGDYKSALDTAKSMAKKHPKKPLSWSILGQLYFNEKKYKPALNSVKKAFQLQNNNIELQLLYAFLLEKNKQMDQALIEYEIFFQRQLNHENMIPRALTYIKTIGGIDKSLSHLKQLAKTKLVHIINFQIYRVLLLWELKKHDEAHRILEKLVAKNPKSAQLLYMNALSFEYSKKIDQAIDVYRKVSQYSDYYVPSRFKMSQLLRSQKKLRASLKIILDVLPKKYSNWELYILAANLHGDLKEYNKATKLLKLGIDRYPTKLKLLFLKGVYEEKSGQIDECIKSMRLLIKKDPSFSSAFNYLGYLYAEQEENLDEAELLILKALALKPSDGYYLDSLAWVYYKQGHYKKALPILEQALKIVPNEGVIMEHIGDVLVALGKEKQGRKFYENALRGKIDDKDKKRVKNKLSSLSS